MRPDAVVSCRLRLQEMVGLQRAFGNASWAKPLRWIAFAWDYLAWMPRAVANESLRQAVHGLDVAYCRDYRQRPEFCNPCLMLQRGVGVLRLTSVAIDVARGCQSLSDENKGRRCAFALPEPSAPHGTQLAPDHKQGAAMVAPARARACDLAGKRMAWKFTCRRQMRSYA